MRSSRRGRTETFKSSVLLVVLVAIGCAGGMGSQAYTVRSYSPGSESEKILAMAEQALATAGTVVGRDKDKGEVYANIGGFAVTAKAEPGSSWTSVTCRADGAWSQGAAPGTWEIKVPATIEYSAKGRTPQDCAEELAREIRKSL